MAFMVMAVIFSPIGVQINPACSQNPLSSGCISPVDSIISNPNCQTNFVNNINCSSSVYFLTNASIAFTPSGYSYTIAAQKQQCESLQINGVAINQVPILGNLVQLPVLGNIADFTIALGQWSQQYFATLANTLAQAVTNNPTVTIVPVPNNSQTIASCTAAASNVILTVSFSGQDIILLFIGAVITSAAVAALTSILLNAGGTIIIFNAMSLTLIFIVLTALGYATWVSIPSPFGSFLYTINTLVFALGIINEAGAIAV
jgi:hypothetical protein